MEDDRPESIKKQFPLRKTRLDICICGHDDSDHTSDLPDIAVKEGECLICICKEFTVKLNG